MKTLDVLKAIMFCLLFSQSTMLLAQSEKLSFVPTIKYDTATFSGKVEGLKTLEQVAKSMKITFTSVLTGDLMYYEIPIKNDGTFLMKIPVECIVFMSIKSDFYNGLNCLIPGEETVLNVKFDKDQKQQVQYINSIGFTADESRILREFPWEGPKCPSEIISPEVFSQRMIIGTQKIVKSIENNDTLTALTKQILAVQTNFGALYHRLFKYNEFIIESYKALNNTENVPKDFHPQIPGESYYSFLKYFNLNEPIYLSIVFYPFILNEILNNEVLAIPDIEDKPINEWLNNVKQIMKDKFGFDNGIVYDLMVCYSYAKQLNYLNPLNEIQKKNIKTYFRNKSFVEVLFAKNEKVLQQVGNKQKTNIYVLTGASENLMDSIITKYKGKVIFVDFWATWCGPCLKAMIESDKVRKEFENKGVVFLYITGTLSPRKDWDQKVYEIGGEQYYVTEKEWEYLNKAFNFDGIPHYLIYDKNGMLKYNYHTFMGNENMKKWIGELL